MIESTLIIASAIGFIGITRMMLSLYANSWYMKRVEKMEGLHPFNCCEFHKLQMERRPWGVHVNDWLVQHHV